MRTRYLSVQLLQRNAERSSSNSAGTEACHESLHWWNQTDAANLPTPDESVGGCVQKARECWPHWRAPAPGAAQGSKTLRYLLWLGAILQVKVCFKVDALTWDGCRCIKVLRSIKRLQHKNRKKKHNNTQTCVYTRRSRQCLCAQFLIKMTFFFFWKKIIALFFHRDVISKALCHEPTQRQFTSTEPLSLNRNTSAAVVVRSWRRTAACVTIFPPFK